jgi:integrating conjugative element protein (TIGR03757 family)
VRPWQVLLLFVASLSTSLSLAEEVVVITDRAHPVTAVPPRARVIYLDAASVILGEIQALPAKPEAAARAAEPRLLKGNPPIHERLATAYQGIVDAWSMGVSHIPAVVVDRKFVVYGESNVSTALRLITLHRRPPQ